MTAIPTISNAMDVGSPSNFARVLELFENRYALIKEKISGYTVSDELTRQTIKNIYDQYNYLPDPHGAVGFYALGEYLRSHPSQQGIVLETAHPVKFPETVESVTGKKIPIPEPVKPIFGKLKMSIQMEPRFNALKEWLMYR